MISPRLLLAVALSGSIIPPPMSVTPRPLILVVHGRGHLARDTADLRRATVRALRAGSHVLSGDSLVADSDVRLVWYADVLDARSAFSSDAVATCASTAGGAESASTSVFSMLALLAGAIVDANAAEQEKQGGDGLRSLAGDLRYLGDAHTRCAAELRLASALARAHGEERPVIVVAHSLGALVSWGHLQRRANSAGVDGLPEIRRLVTLGSPLGSPDIRELVFGDARTEIRLPRSVRSWINVVNEDDPFAVRLLTGVGVEPGHASRVMDAMTERRGEDPHELTGYLRDPVTTRAIVGAWCDAFAEKPRGAVRACERMSGR